MQRLTQVKGQDTDNLEENKNKTKNIKTNTRTV